jgi:hypothetical protein
VSSAQLFAGAAYDPTAADGLIAWQRPGGVALIRRGGSDQRLPGTHPALGGGRIAWREGETIVVAEAGTLHIRERHAAPGAGVLALSDSLLAWRARDAAATDRIWVIGAGEQQPRLLLESPAPTELGRPALRDGRLLCHLAGPAGSLLYGVDVATGAREVLRQERGALLSNPATDGAVLLYVCATGRTQELRIGPAEPADPDDDQVVLVHASSGRRDREHESGRRRHRHRGRRPKLPPRAAAGVVDTLWTTALTPEGGYVTRLHVQLGAPRTADILRVPLAA